MTSSAKISFILNGRNDDYTSGYIEKLNLTLACLAAQALRYEFPVEVIIVEWNPPADQLYLSQCLKKVSNTFLKAMVITVDPKYHEGIDGGENRPIHCLRALNVGIRRSSGRFITPLASDSLLSDEIFEYFIKDGMEDHNVYRLDRCDVSDKILDELTPTEYMQTNLVKLCRQNIDNRYSNQDEILLNHHGIKPLHTNACGDFLLMPKTAWHNMHGYIENCHTACLDGDSLSLYAAVASGLNEVRLNDNCVVYKFSHHKMTSLKIIVADNLSNHIKRVLIKSISKDRIKQKFWSNIFDWPRRKVSGFDGTFPSMERNFTSKARKWMNNPKQQICLNDSHWGLRNVKLPVAEL